MPAAKPSEKCNDRPSLQIFVWDSHAYLFLLNPLSSTIPVLFETAFKRYRLNRQHGGGDGRENSRESWLRSATLALRPYFETCGFSVPDNIRFAIAFPSTGRRGARIGECWHSSTSDDGTFEIIVRADIADPVEVLGVLVHELIHAVLPIDAGHGKLYKEAAIKIGLEGPMRHALPNQLLRPRLVELAESLGALPHARLNIDRGRDNRPADQPKKQRTRLLKAECGGAGCGYTVRITAKWVDDIGAPLCPKHGAMTVDRPEGDEVAPVTQSV